MRAREGCSSVDETILCIHGGCVSVSFYRVIQDSIVAIEWPYYPSKMWIWNKVGSESACRFDVFISITDWCSHSTCFDTDGRLRYRASMSPVGKARSAIEALRIKERMSI